MMILSGRSISVRLLWRVLLLGVVICQDVWSSRIDWKLLENPTSGSRYRSIRHTPLGWFAVGSNGLVKFSPDTRRWFWSQGDPSLPGGRDYRGIAHCQGKTYVVGDSGVVVRTADGLHWDASFVGEPARLASIACSGSEMVAVGDSAVFRSVDGTTWERMPFGRASQWREVVFSSRGYVAVSDSGSLGISLDGRTWVDKVEPSFLFDRLVVHESEVVALGRRRMDSAMIQSLALTAVARSSDGGSTWLTDTSWTVPQELGQLVGLHHDGKRWYGVTSVGIIVSSIDAIQWTYDTLRVPQPVLVVGGATLAYHDGIWMSVGKWGAGWTDSDKLGTSRDLRNWDCVTTSVHDDHAVLVWPWRGDWWVVRSEGNYPASPTAVQRTKDFVHWEESFVGFGFPLHQDTLGSEVRLTGAFLSCRVDTSLTSSCDPARPRQTAFASTSGGWVRADAFGTYLQPDMVVLVRWSRPSDSLLDTLRGRGVVHAVRRFGSRWVAAGMGWTGWATDSGEWHLTDMPSPGYQIDLATDGNVLVLINDTAKIWRSTDGENWQAIRTGSPGSFHQVVHNGRFFAAVGDGGLLGWSRDGADWMYDTVAGSYSVGAPAVSSARSGDSLVVGAPGGNLFLRVRDWEDGLSATKSRNLPGRVGPRRFVDPLGRARSRSEYNFGIDNLGSLPVH